jgi:hypothetical protein
MVNNGCLFKVPSTVLRLTNGVAIIKEKARKDATRCSWGHEPRNQCAAGLLCG